MWQMSSPLINKSKTKKPSQFPHQVINSPNPKSIFLFHRTKKTSSPPPSSLSPTTLNLVQMIRAWVKVCWTHLRNSWFSYTDQTSISLCKVSFSPTFVLTIESSSTTFSSSTTSTLITLMSIAITLQTLMSKTFSKSLTLSELIGASTFVIHFR